MGLFVMNSSLMGLEGFMSHSCIRMCRSLRLWGWCHAYISQFMAWSEAKTCEVSRNHDLTFKLPSSWKTQTLNPLTPNDDYSGRTAPLTSKRCILYIYSTNIGTEYFKHGIYSPFFSSSKCSFFFPHNSNVFGSCIIHILYTGCAKI